VLPEVTSVELPELPLASTQILTIGSLPEVYVCSTDGASAAAIAIQLKWMLPMKVRVFVSFKTTVLDPQGQAIRSALQGHGHSIVTDVRQGKYFDLQLAPGTDRARAEQEMEQIACDVLANPVIEDYRVEFLD
jgi:phosphoribosylformylglycinamidine synthase subunit PurS